MKSGNMETSYVGHLISEGSSTSAVFSDEGQLLAYILCCSDGRILNGSVRSNHRRKGLYQVVSYAYGRRKKWWLLENLSLGFTLWPGTSHCKNSSKSYRSQISAADPTQYSVDWIDYAPGEKDNKQSNDRFCHLEILF